MITETIITVQATRAAVRQALQSIPQEMRAGGAPARAALARCATLLLNHIKTAFLIKSNGGTDAAGDRWAPLSPHTVAYSRRKDRGDRESSRNTRPSQALTKAQQTRWWKVYSHGLAMFRGNKSAAARRAWAILKSEGTTTLFDKYGSRSVRILYDTGALFNSITANLLTDEVRIESKHRAAAAHHKGTRRMPKRRLWPEPRKWPTEWWQDITDQIQQEVLTVVAQRLRGTR